MRGLTFTALMAVVGIAAASDPFAIDPAQVTQVMDDRTRAQREWMAKSTNTRHFQAGDLQVATHDLGIEVLSWQYQRIEPFLLERGETLRQITRQTGWEVCARVCLSRDGYLGLRVQTMGAALSCHVGSDPDDCPKDMIPTQVVVHTHGQGSVVRATAVDNELGHQGEFAWIEHEGNQPSPQDLDAGAGWLLAPNGQVVRYGQHPEWMLD